MSTRTVEESGDSLMGALDGRNRLFMTTLDMRMDRIIEVYVNGLRRIAELDDGYEILGTRLIRLKQAPVTEDTVAVGYSSDPTRPGFANAYPQNLMTEDFRPYPLNSRTNFRPSSLRVLEGN